MASLANKTALVTGASRGIGRATASALANAGAHVLVHYGHSAQDAESLVAGISKATRIADYTVEDFDNLFAINVRSPFFLVQQLLPVFVEGSNVIVISSALARTVVGKPGLENPSTLA